MESTAQHHLSMGIVGASLGIVGIRLLLTEPFSVTSSILAVGGLVVLVVATYSYLTIDPAEFNPKNLTWISGFCAGICFSGMLLVLALPVSQAPP